MFRGGGVWGKLNVNIATKKRHLGRKQNTPKWWGPGVLFSISPIPNPPQNKGTIQNPPYFPLTFHPQNQPNQTGPKRLHITLLALDFS